MSIKRYNNWCLVTHGHDMSPSENGPYVLAADNDSIVAALQAELDACKADGARTRIQVSTFMAYLRLQYPAALSLGGDRLSDEITDFYKRFDAALDSIKDTP